MKLVFHAMHENTLVFLNGGEGIHWAPEIGILPSLSFIIVTIVVTVVASLLKSRSMASKDAPLGPHALKKQKPARTLD